MKKKLLLYLSLTLVMILSMLQFNGAISYADDVSVTTITTSVKELKHGSIFLDTEITDFKGAGYESGDIVSIKIGEREPIVIPFLEKHVSIGFRKCVLGGSTRYPQLAIRMCEGSFVDAYGISESDVGQTVTIDLVTKAGFLDDLKVWNIGSLSSERTDFPDLTDEEFANYRMVTTTGMKKGILYRTSSPINPMINRNKIVDAANRRAGVTTIINLSESPESAEKREGYKDSYYATVNHIEVNMDTNFGEEEFNKKLVQGLRFMLEKPGIYEVNCIFGKDRTGFMIAVLECLAGASYDEVVDDYAFTYIHYYPDYTNYTPIEKRNLAIAEGNLIAQMEYAYGVSDLKNQNLKEATMDYLRKAGMTDDEIVKLIDLLTGKVLVNGDFEYTLNDNIITITQYNGADKDIVIPEKIDGKSVKLIGKDAFKLFSGLNSIKIPGSVTSIDDGAFTGLEKIKYYVDKGSYAEEYLKKHNISYEYSGGSEIPTEKKTETPTEKKTEKKTEASKDTPSKSAKVKAPGKVKISKAKNVKKKKISVKWKKIKKAKGYQLQYSTSKKFKKSKTKTKTTKKTSLTIKKLKKGKTYYVRVRAFTKNKSGKKVSGKWSKVKKVKINK